MSVCTEPFASLSPTHRNFHFQSATMNCYDADICTVIARSTSFPTHSLATCNLAQVLSFDVSKTTVHKMKSSKPLPG
jgi:hypothetical protein